MLSAADLLRVAQLRPELRAVVLPFVADVESATRKLVTIPPRGGLRSTQDQIDLWNARASNPYPVAQPGQSKHEYGAAVDLNIANGTDADYDTAAEIAERYFLVPGLYFTRPDHVHFELRESLEQSRIAFDAMQLERRNYWLIGGAVALVVLYLFTTNRDD